MPKANSDLKANSYAITSEANRLNSIQVPLEKSLASIFKEMLIGLDNVADTEKMMGEGYKQKNKNEPMSQKITSFIRTKMTVAWSMIGNARSNAPSMIGKKLNYPSGSKGLGNYESFMTFAIENPVSAIWNLAWPSRDELFRSRLDAFLFFLRIPNVIFYGLTMNIEAALRGLSALLFSPLNFAWTNSKANPLARIIMAVVGIPFSLIGQMGIFIANTLNHARLVVDSIFNFLPSIFSYFTGGYGEKYPTLTTCLESFARAVPHLLLNLFVIAACLVPGGQIAPVLSSIGLGSVVTAFSTVFSGPLVAGLGNAIGSFFAATMSTAMGVYGSILASSVVAFLGNIGTSIIAVGEKLISSVIHKDLKDSRNSTVIQPQQNSSKAIRQSLQQNGGNPNYKKFVPPRLTESVKNDPKVEGEDKSIKTNSTESSPLSSISEYKSVKNDSTGSSPLSSTSGKERSVSLPNISKPTSEVKIDRRRYSLPAFLKSETSASNEVSSPVSVRRASLVSVDLDDSPKPRSMSGGSRG